MKTETLYTWLGRTDLDCYQKQLAQHPGPVAQAVISGRFKNIRILSNWPEGEEKDYLLWLRHLIKGNGLDSKNIKVSLENIQLTRPTDFLSIYENVSKILIKNRELEDRTYHLSPGTPAMASIWIILSSGEFPAQLIESSLEDGLKDVFIPFNIKADFISKALIKMDALDRQKCFDEIQSTSETMVKVINRASRIAPFDVPVLISGESGTGKELISSAIHKASGRTGRFIAVNCGAIPTELLESEFFGHKKGSFSGAESDHAGYLQQAEKGTLFLDEIGELPLQSQVKLLRSLNDHKIRRVGDTKDINVDIRIIAATNKDLLEEVSKGNFREDLFHRLAVGIISLPPLKERGDDITFLINLFTDEINDLFKDTTGEIWKKRTLSEEAINILKQQEWPGNIRELRNTLTRMILWAEKPIISGEEALFAIIKKTKSSQEETISSVPPNFNLQQYLDDLTVKWLKTAMDQSHGNKSEAAKLLDFKNYQTLSNWLEKYGV
jgi:DNA-binding NtrC family response regulator